MKKRRKIRNKETKQKRPKLFGFPKNDNGMNKLKIFEYTFSGYFTESLFVYTSGFK
jgi:hypothetical protein